MAAALGFLLFLIPLSLGQEDSTVTDVGIDSTDPCKCETRIFDVDEMKGTMKFLQSINCTNPCTYRYYINPLPGYIVSLEDKAVRAALYGSFKSSYYSGEDDETDMFPMGYGDLFQKGSDTPPGVGVFLKYRKPPGATPPEYDFDVSFVRIPVSEARKICPQPVVNVTSTNLIISTANWPRNGCTLRVQSKLPITMRASSTMGISEAKMTLFWKRSKRMVMPKFGAGGASLFTLESGTDIVYRTIAADEEPTDLSFISLDYDPCNCSQTQFIIERGQTISLKSPAYMAMYCQVIQCTYTIYSVKKDDPDHMNTFVVETLSLPPTEIVYFVINGEGTLVDRWFGENHMNILVGEELAVQHYSYPDLYPSAQHGFSMNITAIAQPHDCRCPSNDQKDFYGDDNFEMTIAPHCTYMMCRFLMHAPRHWYNGPINQMLHLDFDYKFHSEVLHVAGEHELLLHSASKRKTFSGDMLSNNSVVMVTCLRQGTPEGLNETSELKMKWHWATKDECSCGLTSFEATTKWSAFYSPRYPQDYCSNMTCTYSVEAPEGHHLKFWVNPFETEPHRDILTVLEGNNTLILISGYLTNHSTTVETIGQEGTVIFHSDATVVAKGFKVSFLAIPNVDYVSEEGDFLEGVAIAAGILLLILLIALCFYLVYKKNVFNRPASSVYSFLPKSDEIVVIDVIDKE